MRRFVITSLMALSFTGVPMFVAIGCDTTEHSKSTEVKDDGTVVKKESKTTENPDGSVTKTETKDVEKPKPADTTKTETTKTETKTETK
jgi:hypothetical protein